MHPRTAGFLFVVASAVAAACAGPSGRAGGDIVRSTSTQISSVPIRVAAGATTSYTDPSGNLWSADTGFSGGVAADDPGQPVSGTSTPTLYDGQRYGDGAGFSYSFGVAAGDYRVTLKFTENWVTGAGQRVFDVAINGQTVLSNFDIYAQAGGQWIAVDETFPVSMPAAGNIQIDFAPGSVQNPKVDAIDVELAPASSIRVAAGATAPYTDPSGHVWSADTGFTGGVATESPNQPVQGTDSAPIYDGQRYGDAAGFSYGFPVAAGDYGVTLRFTENWVTGAGQRRFGVSINGNPVLSEFDIFAEAGGQWIAVDKTFPVSVASAGSIQIQFTPGSVQNPKVDGIDIEPSMTADAGGPPPTDGGGAGDAPATGPGPTASGSFITADFTDMTSPDGVPNVVVHPQLFGVATGGLANGEFSALSNPQTLSLVRALNLPLFRLNANAGVQSSSLIAPLVQHALDLFPSTATWIIGVDSASAATDVASYIKAHSPIACPLWEVHNESQPGQSSSSYDSDALSIAGALASVDPSYRIAGDVSAGLDIGDMQALVGAIDASTLGLLDFHDYLYCAGGSQPSDSEVCLAHRPGSQSNAYAQDQQAIQSAVAGSFASSLPVLLGEYNVECSASFSDLRAGTSTGAAFTVSATLGMASVSTQPVWAAVWDLFDDGGASYNLIDASNNTYPQYYTLQRLIATMPGNMVHTAMGSSAGGTWAWATVSGDHFGVAIVNSNAADVSGQVALSHWPVNATGDGTATLWTYPQGGSLTSPVLNTPGNTSSVAVHAGSTDSITVPARSVAILSYP